MKHPLQPATDRVPQLVLAAVIVFALAACQTLGLTAPKSFTEQLAAGYIAHTAVIKATTAALAAGDIKSSDAEEVLKIATESRRVLDGAKFANEAGDVQTAQGRLAVGVSILAQLQEFVRTKGHP